MNKDAVTWGFVMARLQRRKRAWEKQHKPQHSGIERREDAKAQSITEDRAIVTPADRSDVVAMAQQSKRQYKGLTAPQITAAGEDMAKVKRSGDENAARELLKLALILPRIGMARARMEVMKGRKVPMPKALKPPSTREAIGMPPRALAKETDPAKRLNILFEEP